ncbi:MAG: hypothetical protein Q9191_002686 [Dirinaria sp. TL-2023a]
MPLVHARNSSTSSLNLLSSAFPPPATKRSPRLSATQSEIQASTANAYEDLLLQPRQTSGPLHDAFTDHERDVPKKDEEQKGKALSQRLAGIDRPTEVADQALARILKEPYAKGDRKKADEVLQLLRSTENGSIVPAKPWQKGLGAINRDGVTCWLDALLFAMFGRLDNFESMLTRKHDDEPKRRLAMMIRLWVNLLRTERLITTDITRQLQLALAACGWKEAAETHQQDASEAYSFITDQLALPMLTLKMDLFHSGKEDTSSDHRLVEERVIEVPVPAQPEDGHSISLEDCLTTYFDNRVEVYRYQQGRRNTLNSMKRTMSDDSGKGQTLHIEVASVQDSQPSTPQALQPESTPSPTLLVRPAGDRERMPSIFASTVDPEKVELGKSPSPRRYSDLMNNRRRAGSLKKEVKMSAWQFFNLIPWSNPSEGQGRLPSTDAEVASIMQNRPIVPIALKRSQMENGRSVRRGTFIDIPLVYDMPHFAKDDSVSDVDPLHGCFVLVLQSLLCHQGQRSDFGHYISAVRSPGEGSDSDRWLLMDDLAKERISYIDDIRKFLDKEQPYLLFYRVEPIDPSLPTDSEPPPYSESTGTDSGIAGLSDAPSRHSLDSAIPDHRRGRTGDDRRQSIAFSSAIAGDSNASSTSFLSVDANHNTGGASRRASKTSKVSSSEGEVGRAVNKRSSLSLSRLAGRLSKERSNSSLVASDPSTGLTGKTSRPTTSDGPKPFEAAVTHSRKTSQSHRLGTLSKQRLEKPERECSLM